MHVSLYLAVHAEEYADTQFPELAETAGREQMSYLGFLSELLLAECDDRARRRSDGSRRGCRSASSATPAPASRIC